MTVITVPAWAKINLTLDVLTRRADGYHDIRSVMQTLALHDTLEITHTPDTPGVRLKVIGGEADGVPADETNIVHKAAMRMQKAAAARGRVSGSGSGLHILLTKRIPSQAGLGGGSSDAAATLKALDALFGLRLSLPRLTEIAAALGADVPFFLTGGTALVEGLGERVTLLPPFDFDGWVVLVKPPVGVATARAYSALDAVPYRVSSDATSQWLTGDQSTLGNDFQAVVIAQYPAVAVAFDAMTFSTGDRPLLCGSGAALFRLTPDENTAQALAAHLKASQVGKVWVTRPHRREE